MYLPMVAEPTVEYEGISRGFLKLTKLQDESIDVVHRKESQYERIMRSGEYQKQLLIANAWCAAFIWRKTKDAPIAVTQDVFRQISEDPSSVPGTVIQEIYRLADQYHFFHWHLAFPDVFHVPEGSKKVENEHTGLSGGFDVVLGNPPWERIKLQEKEWFASRRPDIANATNAAVRRKMISSLSTEDPGLYHALLQDRRKSEGESHILRNSGRFPLCGRGDINTYTVFAENKRMMLNQTGRVGCIVPLGIATDDTTKLFFQDLMNSKSLVSLFDFENKKGNILFSKRFPILKNLFGDSKILTNIEQKIVRSDVEVQELLEYAVSQGWEGLILRKDVLYKGKRSNDLLKVKIFIDAEYTINDVEMNVMRVIVDGLEVEENMLASIKIKHKGYVVSVGSGFSLEERRKYYKNPELIIGKIVTVRYFKESRNQKGEYSLQFPTKKHIHLYERD